MNETPIPVLATASTSNPANCIEIYGMTDEAYKRALEDSDTGLAYLVGNKLYATKERFAALSKNRDPDAINAVYIVGDSEHRLTVKAICSQQDYDRFGEIVMTQREQTL